MNLATFAINNGLVEAQIRGFRLGFLSEANYAQMKALHSLDELCEYLSSETDYGEYIDISAVSVNAIKSAMRRKLADEIAAVESNCSSHVFRFVFYIRATYMIDNVVNILEGVKTGAAFKSLLAAADPLGDFPELAAMEIAGGDLALLYETVLIDTPVSEFFARYLEERLARAPRNSGEVQSFFGEERPEQIRSGLKRVHLERFAEFCQTLNSVSADAMSELLARESDFRTIQIVYNSIDDAKEERLRVRESLCSPLGNLYPLHTAALRRAESVEQLREALRGAREYRALLDGLGEAQGERGCFARTLEDAMYEEEARRLALVFDEQASLAVLYAHVRLKQQEIRNVVWIAEMISRNIDKNHKIWRKIIIPFSD